jgi:2-polyprenyl-6-methoxyphenol hydroxylase-like FAD-dependent oxidoreductase
VPKIAIVGLGFAGAAAALLLERGGHQVTLFEATPEPGPVGAGILLQPSGQAVLERLGILPIALRHAQRIHALRARNTRGRFFMDLPLQERPTYGVRRGHIFQALYDTLQRSNVQLRCGTRIDAVRRDGLIPRMGSYDLVVLADGSRSALRTHLDGTIQMWDYGIGALWFQGHSAFPGDHLHQVSQGTRRLCGLLPTGQGTCSFFWSCTRAEFRAYKDDWPARLQRDVRQLAPEAEPILGAADKDQLLFADYRHGWLSRWCNGKLCVIGDAAHPMSPHLGQGVNLGLLDAYSLARSISQTTSIEQALKRYETVRRRQVALYSTLSFALTPFFQSKPDLLQSWGRDFALPLMLRWRWMADHMRHAVYGQKGGWFAGWRELDDIT